jgi:hypothetical protein
LLQCFIGGIFVAHLIKLEDYVSRYQYDMYRYPSQFSRLKLERWKRLKQEWEASSINDIHPVKEQAKSSKGAFDKLKSWYNREQPVALKGGFEEPPYRFKYKSLPELKKFFLQELYEFQLNWASSTIVEKSTMQQVHHYDVTLKWLLQSIPDNYFVLYYPTITYPKATVQFDILLVGPTDIWCIVNLSGKENTIFQTFSERYWLEVVGDEEKKIINPFLSLNRMSMIIKRVLVDTELDMTVQKMVLSQEGYIDVQSRLGGTQFLDQRNVKTWNQKQKNNPSPIKSTQLKFSQAILNFCQTTSVTRPVFDNNDEDAVSVEYED